MAGYIEVPTTRGRLFLRDPSAPDIDFIEAFPPRASQPTVLRIIPLASHDPYKDDSGEFERLQSHEKSYKNRFKQKFLPAKAKAKGLLVRLLEAYRPSSVRYTTFETVSRGHFGSHTTSQRRAARVRPRANLTYLPVPSDHQTSLTPESRISHEPHFSHRRQSSARHKASSFSFSRRSESARGGSNTVPSRSFNTRRRIWRRSVNPPVNPGFHGPVKNQSQIVSTSSDVVHQRRQSARTDILVNMISSPIAATVPTGIRNYDSMDMLRQAATGSRPSTRSNSPGPPSFAGIDLFHIADPVPVANGTGFALYIDLAEPVLYLLGFEHPPTAPIPTAMLRGKLHLRITKPTKIKDINLCFKGTATTEWPDGMPNKSKVYDKHDVMSHYWRLFSIVNGNEIHNVASYKLADSNGLAKAPITTVRALDRAMDYGRSRTNTTTSMTAREARRLSLGSVPSNSFSKSDPDQAKKGFKMFQPGHYVYTFEHAVPANSPESITAPLGSVQWTLNATVDRPGLLKQAITGTKPVELVRAPMPESIESVEPIAISRDWEDQLHYDIVISGKSFPMGSVVPIAFKLTPLAKVQCHRIKVYISESINYYSKDKKAHRTEGVKKHLLFEKKADDPGFSSTYQGSKMRILAGGGVSYGQRAQASAGNIANVRTTPTNILGDLLAEHNIGPTEIELDVALPTCYESPKHHGDKIHCDSNYQHIQVNHWIKIVLRLSKADEQIPDKRRHFEISIDSPFHILSCHSTQLNTMLPAYTESFLPPGSNSQAVCSCPRAPMRDAPSSFNPLEGIMRSRQPSDPSSYPAAPAIDANVPGLARPEPAHVANAAHAPIATENNPHVSRPIHLTRLPSWDPPSFADVVRDPPPALPTPPPGYEGSSGDSRSGLADYFARLADEIDDVDDINDRGSFAARMQVPLTPGGRVNRSMDDIRTWGPIA